MSCTPAPGRQESPCLTLGEEEGPRAASGLLLSRLCEHEHLRVRRPAKGALIKVERTMMPYEYPNFQGQQFILEEDDHSPWSA